VTAVLRSREAGIVKYRAKVGIPRAKRNWISCEGHRYVFGPSRCTNLKTNAVMFSSALDHIILGGGGKPTLQRTASARLEEN
jgi:hypothetical protein